MGFKNFKKKLVAYFGPWLAFWVIRILGWTIRFEEINGEIPRQIWGKTPAIGIFWHGRLLMMPLIPYQGKQLNFLVSPHRDGQIIGKALKRFGFHAILGSTHRKGFAAFRELLKDYEADIAIVPDGPKGPRYVVKIGVVELAKRTGRPIIPVTYSVSKYKMFHSWDHFILPYPFSKGVFIWGEPVTVDPHGDPTYLEAKRIFLEECLKALTEQADHYFDPVLSSPSSETVS